MLTNDRTRALLSLAYTPVGEYLPGLVARAAELGAERVKGDERRTKELALPPAEWLSARRIPRGSRQRGGSSDRTRPPPCA